MAPAPIAGSMSRWSDRPQNEMALKYREMVGYHLQD